MAGTPVDASWLDWVAENRLLGCGVVKADSAGGSRAARSAAGTAPKAAAKTASATPIAETWSVMFSRYRGKK
jgi:hypothetical protein